MIEVTCPSGLKGRIRGMKVKDEELFANRKLVQTGGVIGRLLQSCWAETLDPGPYQQLPDNQVIDWDDMLTADRSYLLIQLRIASYGPEYEFRVTCNACKSVYNWGVDLEELDTIPVSDEGKQHLSTGEPIPVKLLDERVAYCRLLTGADEMFLARAGAGKNEDKILTYHLARRIKSIDGKDRWKDILDVVADMEARVADALWDVTDELEGGTEITFDVRCEECGNTQEVLLPFEAGFFSSRKRFTRSKKKRIG